MWRYRLAGPPVISSSCGPEHDNWHWRRIIPVQRWGLIDRQGRRYRVHEKALNSLIGMQSYQQVRRILSKATQEIGRFGHFAGLTRFRTHVGWDATRNAVDNRREIGRGETCVGAQVRSMGT